MFWQLLSLQLHWLLVAKKKSRHLLLLPHLLLHRHLLLPPLLPHRPLTLLHLLLLLPPPLHRLLPPHQQLHLLPKSRPRSNSSQLFEAKKATARWLFLWLECDRRVARTAATPSS